MIEKIIRFWTIRELRNKVLVTLFLLAIVRILIFIPLPLIQTTAISRLFDQNAFLGFLNIFSGGGLENFSITTMGVGPYITASIIMQLLGIIVPQIEELQNEGEYGQRKINQYTRYLTFPLGIIQAYGVLILLRQNGVVATWTPTTLAVTLLMMTAGTLFVMWLGEIITERGIGNGISLIITLGILGALPLSIQNLITTVQTSGSYTMLISLAVITILSIVFVIIINEAKRLVPVAYARWLRSGGSFGSVPSHLPIKVNTAGVVPIIFAIAMLTIPVFLGQFFTQARTAWLANAANWLVQTFQPNTTAYNVIYFVLVFAFTFFYTNVLFTQQNYGENLKRVGAQIPGVSRGAATQRYLNRVLSRITLPGALFLGVVAIMPWLISLIIPQFGSTRSSSFFLISSAGLLIVVGVVRDTFFNIQAELKLHGYDDALLIR